MRTMTTRSAGPPGDCPVGVSERSECVAASSNARSSHARTAGRSKNSSRAERRPRLALGSICSLPRIPEYRRTRLDIPPKLSRGHAQSKKRGYRRTSEMKLKIGKVLQIYVQKSRVTFAKRGSVLDSPKPPRAHRRHLKCCQQVKEVALAR